MNNSQPSNLLQYAMRYGTSMGLLWIAKFFILLLGLFSGNVLLLALGYLVFMVATLSVPFLAFFMARQFRNRLCGGILNFSSAWLFITFIYLFAALLAAVGHYVYFQFIDGGGAFFSTLFSLAESNDLSSQPELKQMFEQSRDLLLSLRPIDITMQLLSSNILYGTLQAFFIALFVARRKAPGPKIMG
ncbi:MAG: DUF4199 domain-containing protein [Bacteroidaceae bacterium]|jgi:hypothetical protein